MPGSWDLETQQEISLRVSFLTTLMLAISGCFVTSSPVCTCMCMYVWGGGEWGDEHTCLGCLVFLTTLLDYQSYWICTECSSCSYEYHTTLAQHPQDEVCLGIEGIVHAVEPHEFVCVMCIITACAGVVLRQFLQIQLHLRRVDSC